MHMCRMPHTHVPLWSAHTCAIQLIMLTRVRATLQGANLELKARHGLTIIGPRADAARIPGIDTQVGDGDTRV